MSKAMQQRREEKPETITLELVWQMFSEVKDRLDNIEKNEEGRTERIIEKCQERIIDDFSGLIEDNATEVMKIKADLAFYKHKTDVLTNVCNSLHGDVHDLTQRLEGLELSNAKRSVCISGLSLPMTKKDEMAVHMEEFINKNVQVQVAVEDVYTLGTSENKTLVVEFQSIHEKREVIANKANLKDVRVKGRKVYINEFLPITTQEKRRRERQIKKDLESNEETKNLTVEYTRAGLTIEGKPYRKMVSPPTPKEMVSLTVEELEEVLKMKTIKGGEEALEGSRFAACAAKVKSIVQVRKLYIKQKLTRPDAKHIVCAYYLPGVAFQNADFHDDGEPGSGRILLDLLTRNNLEGWVIFVARKYGGIKLGADRFKMYIRSACDVLSLNPNEQMLKPKNPALQQNARVSQQKRDWQGPEQQSYGRYPTDQDGYRRSYFPKSDRQSQPYGRGYQPMRQPRSSTQQMKRGGMSRYNEMMQQQNGDPHQGHTQFAFAKPMQLAWSPPTGNRQWSV